MSSNNQRLKTLYILKILMEKTDELHPMTVNEIIDELKQYGISAERKSIYTDVELLRTFGVDIICDKTKTNNYYIAGRDFQLAELKLLVDAVQASKFITHKKSDELIEKIEKLASVHEAQELRRQVIVTDRIKSMNESIYYSVDALHLAIQNNKKVQFKYFDYTVDKRLKFRRNGEIYCVSPFALTWVDENYYLIAYHERYKDISHFRVDRMAEIEVSDEVKEILEGYKDFNVVEYSKSVFRMFSGDTEKVELEFDNSLINVVIDRFGRDITIYDKSSDCFKISIDVAVTNTFFSWMFMLGTKARIIGPDSIAAKYKKLLIESYKKYEF